MTPQTFLFFGRSGCGKGTQAKLLIEKLQQKDPGAKVIYVETGSHLRTFAGEANYSASLTADIMAQGGLMPSFIPIWIWTDYLIRHMNGSEHLVLDGLSRRFYEATILDDALRFYKRQQPIVINIEVSEKWATDHLLARKRADDTKLDIKARLEWYQTSVIPAIEFLGKSSYYKMVNVNGEQTIDEVHKEIMEKIGL